MKKKGDIFCATEGSKDELLWGGGLGEGNGWVMWGIISEFVFDVGWESNETQPQISLKVKVVTFS